MGSRPLVVFQGLLPENKPLTGMMGRMLLGPFEFLGEKYTVYVVNRWPVLPQGYTLADMANDYAIMVQGEFGGPVDVIGMSTGGSIAQIFAADHLAHADGSMDVVLCAQILQFLENRSRALAEMSRVLEPSGRISVSLWCEIQKNPYFDVLVAAIASHIGDETASGLGAAFGLTDHDEILALLVAAGFDRVEISTTLLELDLPPMEDFVPLHISATPMAAGFKAAPEERRRAVVQEINSRFDSFQVDDRSHRVPFSSYFARGYKV